MNLSIYKKIVTAVFACAILSSCTEQYVFQNQDIEKSLIVEGTITNELTFQEITLSRTSSVSDTIKLPETGAQVKVVDSNGTEFNFDETDGKYVSVKEFKAVPNTTYQLRISTASGKSYASSNETLTTANTLDLETKVIEKDGQKGVQIIAKSFDPTNTSIYYRFKYNETFKVITKYVLEKEITLIENVYTNNNQLIFSPAKPNTSICYSTNYSKGIIQVNTSKLSEDRVALPIIFIGDYDYKLKNQYSIEVSEYTQSRASYDYYNTSKKMSESGELLSPNQPGYIIGNVKSISNPVEKVVGFFEVASVAKKRIFFNYKDIFSTGEAKSYFFYFCVPKLLSIKDVRLNEDNVARTHVYIGDGPGLTPTSYYMVERECADCTIFSSNVKPSFWID